MRYAIGRRLFRLGLRLMGLDPECTFAVHAHDFRDPHLFARYAADVWLLESRPLTGVSLLLPKWAATHGWPMPGAEHVTSIGA